MKAASNISSRPSEPIDFSSVESVQRALLVVSDELTAMTEDVAKARTVREFEGDRRKRALALAVREFLAQGDSAAAADTKGRASVAYGEVLDAQSEQFEAAESILTRWDALRARFDAARSVLSSLRAIAGQV